MKKNLAKKRSRVETKKPSNRKDQGLSLIEVMVALLLFTLAFLTFAASQNQGLRFVSAAEAQFYARIASENKMIEIQLSQSRAHSAYSPRQGNIQLGGYDFIWQHHTSAAPQGFILHDVVILAPDSQQELARLTSLGPTKNDLANIANIDNSPQQRQSTAPAIRSLQGPL